ncbi:Alpha/Beta hydrolase protein [Mycena vulgaris]|nr:Alpha/Beta hydrolase protein [Mycena vulgaris]
MTELREISDIPYSAESSPLLQFDLYVDLDSPKNSGMVVFVHGGAWRAEDKADHRALARSLATASHCPVLVPNYRLTTQHNDFRHPRHAEDILRFLVFITTWDGVPDTFNPAGRSISLEGHSAGAHILTSIFLDSSKFFPTLTPPPTLLERVRGIALSEGLYDLDLFIARFPETRNWFIAPAFGDLPSFADASTTALPLHAASNIKWLVIHSSGDTLVDMPQSEAVHAHLRKLYDAAADAHVATSFDQLDVDHDDVVRSPEFVKIICMFVEGLQ